MAKQSRHALREYHVLVVRDQAGFVWQIRYDRNARPFKVSEVQTHDAADSAGRKALAALKADLAGQS